ncbi:NAD(P)H-dependent oxidoreductase [Soonwooa sp.]|uniref:NAD(P)H-dependent oxidoreductase n=1 Tax=Soonwooa sp. TaxID=1938592 RepID=UPI002614347F|nr:NAD(P)H-dependent oxidoreductase [Soonwooa sp.]
MKKTLVLFAHPYFEHSTTNVELVKVYEKHSYTVLRDIYEEYPDFHIQPFRERKRMQNFDRVIFHFPLIWFGMPPLLKLWIDEVMDFKWMCQDDDNPFSGKEAIIVVTAGANEESYSEKGMYHTKISDLTLGLKLCIETNNLILKDEIIIYQADDIKMFELESYMKKLNKILNE